MKKVSTIKLYFKFLSIHLRSSMQYKTSFILTTIGQFLVSFTAFIGIHFMFERFCTVEGYTYNQSLLCFATIITSFSLAECFARGLDTFPTVISNGEFDRILVRPRGEIFQVITSKVALTRMGRLLQAIIVFAYAIPTSGVDFTIDKIICLALMIICGMLVFTGVFIIFAFLCFYTTDGLEFMNILTDGMREYGKYPLAIYGKEVLLITTFVVPYSLIQYYPFLYLIGEVQNPMYILLPPLASLFLIPCFLLWKVGVRHYRSTGS
jgi:ABC-2 type transport system permease protein